MKNEKLYTDIKWHIAQAKSFVLQNINTTLVFTNYHIGKRIVEDEQRGSQRAKYAEKTLKNLSKKLTKEFGRGYSVDNLQRTRNFHLTYQSRIYATLSHKSLKKSATALHKSSRIEPQIKNELISQQTLFSKFKSHFPLSWSHYSLLLKIENEEENKTIGIVLCKQTNKTVVEYTLPEKNNRIFAREYRLYLPSKKQLQDLLLEKI